MHNLGCIVLFVVIYLNYLFDDFLPRFVCVLRSWSTFSVIQSELALQKAELYSDEKCCVSPDLTLSVFSTCSV